MQIEAKVLYFKEREAMRFLKNVKGQAAIFVVLIFQVLFILFAMSINVAMVTYDKINLQNSLDLAAYYGAKKQAEVLNAMAHINYQMRQNWKLLAWRYRILGTLAQYRGVDNPYNQKYPYPNEYWCPQNIDENTHCIDPVRPQPPKPECRQAQSIFQQSAVYGSNYCDKYYFVCISHDLWKRGVSSDRQNLCTKARIDIPRITLAERLPGPLDFLVDSANRGVTQLQEEVDVSCPAEGALNWLMTQIFMTHFRLDQKDRKVMMMEIYNRSLKVGKDLDGKSIFDGAKKVFCNNLSLVNRKNAKFCTSNSANSSSFLKDFNSFKKKEFKDIFKKINVAPVLQFLYDTRVPKTCPMAIGVHFKRTGLAGVGADAFDRARNMLNDKNHAVGKYLKGPVKSRFRFNFFIEPYHQDPLIDLTLSFFKELDKTLYYGLRVKFDYEGHQVFSLNLSDPIVFRASAFAKAFGASFGPQPEQSDPLIPVFPKTAPKALTKIPNITQKINPFLLQPNYSRFPGDKWGLLDARLHDNRNTRNFLNKHFNYKRYPSPSGKLIKRAYTMEDYFHLTLYTGLADDPLARNDDPFTFTRMMELMAVYPDLYDISYYSILGNYHQTYFEKICKLLQGSECKTNKRNPFSSTASQNRDVYIRGDFGWPDTEDYIDRNYKEKEVELSIAPYFLYQGKAEANFKLINKPDDITKKNSRQIEAVLQGRNWPLTGTKGKNPPPLSQGNLFYPWLARSEAKPDSAKLPHGLLSSWTNPNPLDYNQYGLDKDRFLKCKDGVAVKGRPVPSACAAGGRSGYSVKLISCEAVKDFSNKPSDIDDYCPK